MKLATPYRAILLSLLAASNAIHADELSAPKPSLNSSAHVWLTFRVTSTNHNFDNIAAEGKYALTNHSCAPKRLVSGSYVEQPANVPAEVRREGDAFVIRVLKDRYAPDACAWVYTGMSARLYKGHTLVGLLGTTPLYVNRETSPVGYTCNPHSDTPPCINRRTFPNAEAFKASHPDSFDIEVELSE